MTDLCSVDPAFPSADRPIVMTPAGEIRWSTLIAAAHALRARLPPGPAAVNLCERRENFLIGLLALLIGRRICVLPPSRAPAAVAEVLAMHQGGFCLDDALVETGYIESASAHGGGVELDLERALLIAFTSGSTGKPTANPKTWASFTASARLNAAALHEALAANGEAGMPWILATVPSQHMYGVETTVLLPLLAGMGIHSANPLYPADIDEALRQLPAPRILVTTPAHLRPLLQSGVQLPRLAAIVCATAPLTAETALSAEKRFGTRVVEMFGATETCVIASRRTTIESSWLLYRGVDVAPRSHGTLVGAPWLPGSVLLQDIFDLRSAERFDVVGRHSDMVKIAGKRASLAALTRHLVSIPGVIDAVMLQPDPVEDGKEPRLGALVVADGLTVEEILKALAELVDPVFLPRPLALVDRLPRNEVGKLPRDRLLDALGRSGGSSRERSTQP